MRLLYFAALFLLLLYSCDDASEPNEKDLTIAEVRVAFDLLSGNRQADGRLERTTIDWEHGTYQEITAGDALVFPLEHVQGQYVSPTEDGVLYPIQQQAYAFAYRDGEEDIALEYVQVIPTATTDRFTGFVTVADWNDEIKHVIYYENGLVAAPDSNGRTESCTQTFYYDCVDVSVGGEVVYTQCTQTGSSIDCAFGWPELDPEDYGRNGSGNGEDDGIRLCPHPFLEGQYVDCPDDIVICEEGSVVNASGECVNIHIDMDRDGKESNPCEVRFTLRHPPTALKIYDNSILAENKEQEIFGAYVDGNGKNDCGDAFRHVYFAFLNVVRVGEELTRKFNDAHECDSPSTKETDMDMFNNEVGIQLANANPNLPVDELVQTILTMLYDGDLRILSDLNPENDVTLYSQLIPSLVCAE